MKIKIFKKFVPLFIVVIMLFTMTSCQEKIALALYSLGKIGGGSEYESYESFAGNYEVGVEKQNILDKFDCPDSCYDDQGIYYYRTGEKDEWEKTALDSNCTIWVYECYKYDDMSFPYKLEITFDGNGKLLSAELIADPFV